MIIKINSRNQITIPKSMCEELNIKAGDRLIVDIQDGLLVLIPEPTSYANHLQGLHGGMWKGVDLRDYLKAERDAWTDRADE